MQAEFSNLFTRFKSSIFSVDGVIFLTLFLLFTSKLLLSWLTKRKRPPGLMSLPIVGSLPFLGKKPHETLWKMKKKYGDIISLYMGPNYSVVLNDYRVAEKIMNHPAVLDRSPVVFSQIPEKGVMGANGGSWVEQRRFFMSSMKDLGLGKTQHETLQAEAISNYVQFLNATNEQPIDVHHSLGMSIVSSNISMLIGRILTQEETHKIDLALEFTESLPKYSSLSDPATLIPGLRKSLELLKIAGYDKADRVMMQFLDFLKDEISNHKKTPDLKNVKNFISIFSGKGLEMNKSNTKKYVISDETLLGNLNAVFLGSTDTIIKSLMWLFPLMAKFQNVQSKVYNEVMEVLGIDAIAGSLEKEKVPYTYAVFLEMLRYCGLSPIQAPRRISDAIEINGYIIPKGTDVMMNLWGLHHDPAYWDEPHAFKPERFFVGEKKVNPNPPSFVPFSIGKRNCPGRNVAEMKVLAYFTEIIKQFRITPEPGKDVNFEAIPGLLTSTMPQKFCFIKRSQDF